MVIIASTILLFQFIDATNQSVVNHQPSTISHSSSHDHDNSCRMSSSDGIIIVERLIRLIANMYIAYLNPLWTLLAALGTVLSYGIHFAYESYAGNNPKEIYDLPWCMLSAWSLVMDWMIIAAYMVVQTTSHIGSELLGIIVGCVLVSMGIHSTSQAFPGGNATLRNLAIIVWLFIYFPWIYWPYVSLFEPYGCGSYRQLLPHQRLMTHFLKFFYNFWYSLNFGSPGYGYSYSYPGCYSNNNLWPSTHGYSGYQQANSYCYPSSSSWWSSLFGSYSPWSQTSQSIYNPRHYCSMSSYRVPGYTASGNLPISSCQIPYVYDRHSPYVSNYVL